MAKVILSLVIVASFLSCAASASSGDSFSRCLPAGVNLDQAVAVEQPKPGKKGSGTQMTVRMRLSQLRARCKTGKLLSSSGKEIRFLILLGCWGNPPENYQEMLAEQAQKIERLKKKYILIQIPCGQGRDLRTIN